MENEWGAARRHATPARAWGAQGRASPERPTGTWGDTWRPSRLDLGGQVRDDEELGLAHPVVRIGGHEPQRLAHDGGRGVLMPENPAFEPIEMTDGRILGTVVAVLRKL